MTQTTRQRATLIATTDLGANVIGLEFQCASRTPSFLAGQYLHVLHPDGTAIPFSIASPPRTLPALALHYRPTIGSEDARRMDEIIARGGTVELELPLGTCGITSDPPRDLLLIAGGTGISQARSILLEHAERMRATAIRLYWGAAQQEDLYLAAELDALAARAPRFDWTPVLEQDAPPPSNTRTGSRAGSRSGRVADALAADVRAGAIKLADWDILICGGPPMVWGSIATLRQVGLTAAQTRSDVLDYAPRTDLWSS